jgi:hypothetical protein
MTVAANTIKTLTKQGDLLVFVLDDETRRQWQIDAKTPLKVTVEGDKLILEARRESISQQEFDAAVSKVTMQFEQTFRKLAE